MIRNASFGTSMTSRPMGTPATVAPPGWASKEATVHPTHSEFAAGLDSYVDNTMRLKPLQPRYGKTREITPAEIPPSVRKLAPDLLVTSKGLDRASLPILDSPEKMGAVLGPYAPNADLFCQGYGPERHTAGFLRSPTKLGGRTFVDDATSSFKNANFHATFSPNADATWQQKKFAFDQTANIPHIPVAKRVGTNGYA